MKQNPKRLGRRALVLAAVAATALAALPAAAAAAPADGKVKLTFKAKTKSSLLRQGVRVDGGKGGTQVSDLSAKRAWEGSPERIRAAGTVVLSSGKRKAKLRAVQVAIRGRTATVSAKLDKQRSVFFRARGGHRGGESWFQLKSGDLKLTGKGAALLRKRLKLDGGLAGRVGSLVARAKLESTPAPIVAPPAAPTPAPTPTPLPDPDPEPEPEPEKEAYPYEVQCPVPAVEGGGGFADAPGQVEGIAPAPVFNSGTAQEAIGTEVDWGFKASFRSYVAFVPPTGSLQAVEGATANPSEELMSLPESFFGFAGTEGTYEPGVAPDHSDDRLVADGGGAALFCKPGHGFDVVIKNPTVTIDGEESRITADVGVNLNGTWYPFQRADIATLDLEGFEPEIADSGNTLTWEDIPATLTEDGEIATGGIYEAGEELDPVTVSASLDRPLLAQCSIDAGSPETLPAVAFPPLALPDLGPEAETGSGGTIDWGLMTALRYTVGKNGEFVLLGGASGTYPDMGGVPGTPPPVGGVGKAFQFPVSDWEWDEGEESDPTDDRLIATSEATVSLCNPKHGYAAVLSKPTLVIDGGESSLIANAYSFQKAKGWVGGRVALAALDTGAVEAEASGGAVSWGDVPGPEETLDSGIEVDQLTSEALSLAAVTEATEGSEFDPLSVEIELADK